MNFKPEVGIDIVEINRVAESIKNERFLIYVYGENELRELKEKNMLPQSAAGCFAAKEAFSKSLGTGIRGFKLSEAELLHDELGKPYLKLSGKAAEIAESKGLAFSVSISHTKELAAAFVIAYPKTESE